MTERMYPYPSAYFGKQVSEAGESMLFAAVSGQITAGRGETPLGAPKRAGNVRDVWFSVAGSGKDDNNTLSLTLNVLKNGTTVLTTQPIIAHVSGEAATNKTTKEEGDTGITQAVVDPDAAGYNPGDVFTYTLALTRTASPTTEMQNGVIVVELEPVT